MNLLRGLFQLIRFELPFSAGICVVLGQIFATNSFNILTALSAFISVFFISGAILVLNDYFDVETDRINAPHRPIPMGLVSPRQALVWAIIIWLAGLIISYTININSFLLAILLSIIGFVYNRFFKKSGLPGNLLVSFSVGMTFIYGGASVGYAFNQTVLFFALIAGLVDLGEEIAADAMDAEGDRLINSQSIALLHGSKRAIKISFVLFLIVIILSSLPFVIKWFSLIYLIPIVIMDAGIMIYSIKLLTDKREKGRNYIRAIYLSASLGMLIFLVMRLLNI